jgi:hypothetical protein
VRRFGHARPDKNSHVAAHFEIGAARTPQFEPLGLIEPLCRAQPGVVNGKAMIIHPHQDAVMSPSGVQALAVVHNDSNIVLQGRTEKTQRMANLERHGGETALQSVRADQVRSGAG